MKRLSLNLASCKDQASHYCPVGVDCEWDSVEMVKYFSMSQEDTDKSKNEKSLAVLVVLWKVGSRWSEPFSCELAARIIYFRIDWLWNFRRSLSRQNEKMLWRDKRCGRRIVSLLIFAGLWASLGCVSSL